MDRDPAPSANDLTPYIYHVVETQPLLYHWRAKDAPNSGKGRYSATENGDEILLRSTSSLRHRWLLVECAAWSARAGDAILTLKYESADSVELRTDARSLEWGRYAAVLDREERTLRLWARGVEVETLAVLQPPVILVSDPVLRLLVSGPQWEHLAVHGTNTEAERDAIVNRWQAGRAPATVNATRYVYGANAAVTLGSLDMLLEDDDPLVTDVPPWILIDLHGGGTDRDQLAAWFGAGCAVLFVIVAATVTLRGP